MTMSSFSSDLLHNYYSYYTVLEHLRLRLQKKRAERPTEDNFLALEECAYFLVQLSTVVHLYELQLAGI